MRALARSVLKRGMLSWKDDAYIDILLSKITSSAGYLSHGAVIDYDEAKELGIKAEYLSPESDLWRRVWLLYCMYDYDTKQGGIGKIFEEKKWSISRPR